MEFSDICPTPASEQLKNCRILLVEDDKDHQPLLALMMRKAGAEVTLADNGLEAVDAVFSAQDRSNPFDIIVMDLQMPVLDGISATECLRVGGVCTPVIALTARVLASDRQKCLAAGFDDFLSKPFTKSDLLRLLCSHSRREKLLQNAAAD